MTKPATTEEAMRDEHEMVVLITRKVRETLAPLERYMNVLQWPNGFRAIMWEVVMLEAKQRMEEAQGKRL